ncbi:MAG: glycosyltransferase family 4 protein, partial [bacterium]
GLALARLRGALTVVDCDDFDGADRGPLLALAVRALQGPAFHLAHMACTHHPDLKRVLESRLGLNRVVDLAQGADLDLFKGAHNPRAAARRRWGLERGRPCLAFTAHLNIACRLPMLISLLGPWLRNHPKAVLLVAGSGPWGDRFKALAAPLGAQVRFLGQLSPADCADVLAASDCLVTAYGTGQSDRHRVPMKVGEALSLGVPVVTTPLAGLRHLARFVEQAQPNPKAFGEALDRALRSGKARAGRGRTWVRRELDWTRVAARFLDQLRHGHVLPYGIHEAMCPQP